jgi:hypothetical protein
VISYFVHNLEKKNKKKIGKKNGKIKKKLFGKIKNKKKLEKIIL